MDIGIVTNGFGHLTSSELARMLAKNGFKSLQLFFAQKDYPVFVYNGRPDQLDFARAAGVIANYRSAIIILNAASFPLARRESRGKARRALSPIGARL